MSKKDPLAGVWYSGVGSKLELEVDGSRLTGSFDSAEAPGGRFPVYGSVDLDSTLPNRALAFTVSWIQEGTKLEYRSVTSYTGQYHSLPDGEEVIRTTFLLAEETRPGKEYASTYVGYDNFKRTAPSSNEVKTARATRPSQQRSR
jgi:hypothetical protein